MQYTMTVTHTRLRSAVVPLLAIASFAVVLFTGFQCAAGEAPTLTVRRFSSIPPIARHIIYRADGTATLLEPPNTKSPYAFSLSTQERDSLELLLADAPQWDSVYAPTMVIPNPSHLYLDIPLAGGGARTIHIANFPTVPPHLQALLELTGRIEDRAEQAVEEARRR